MNKLLQQLSSVAHIKIRNRFTGFFASPEAVIWHLEAEHCTHRGHFYKGKGANLEMLITEAIAKMEEIEQRYANKMKALAVLHPHLNDYQIADMARTYE
jgi:hypothetical protein